MTSMLEKFTLFTSLPPEIRLRIWGFASPQPRIIEITYNSKARCLVSLTRPPALLHTSHESRTYTIKSFTPFSFGDNSQIILVDFQHDTLFFGPGCKCLVPSGKSNPWIKQNPKVIKDIICSVILAGNLERAAFDCGFLLALDRVDVQRSAAGVVASMAKLSDVMLVRTVARHGDRHGESVRVGVGRRFNSVKAFNEIDRNCLRLLSSLDIYLDAYELVGEGTS